MQETDKVTQREKTTVMPVVHVTRNLLGELYGGEAAVSSAHSQKIGQASSDSRRLRSRSLIHLESLTFSNICPDLELVHGALLQNRKTYFFYICN